MSDTRIASSDGGAFAARAGAAPACLDRTASGRVRTDSGTPATSSGGADRCELDAPEDRGRVWVAEPVAEHLGQHAAVVGGRPQVAAVEGVGGEPGPRAQHLPP